MYRAESTCAIRISYERGSALPVNAGASALVLPAWSPDDEARRLLQPAELRRFTPAGIAAPIRDENKQAVAAVSVAALASRVCPEAETEIAQKVKHMLTDRGSPTAGPANGPGSHACAVRRTRLPLASDEDGTVRSPPIPTGWYAWQTHR
ncbi:IclR family transcriptional regulator C-terminal domain-containing protein [Streptomyces sp. NPDC001663]|uniref:IclR family transcriptional regulator domain-containing protein n=1 Tax=Streptomyces sp. NPDC001663 TaxID=3364597 RepID=UPI0036D06DE6